jgi:hypothetical protein
MLRPTVKRLGLAGGINLAQRSAELVNSELERILGTTAARAAKWEPLIQDTTTRPDALSRFIRAWDASIRACPGSCTSFRVITALEYQFAKLGHRGLFVTHIYRQARGCKPYVRVRRAKCSVQTRLTACGIG